MEKTERNEMQEQASRISPVNFCKFQYSKAKFPSFWKSQVLGP